MVTEMLIMFTVVNVAYIETLTNSLNIFCEQKAELF